MVKNLVSENILEIWKFLVENILQIIWNSNMKIVSKKGVEINSQTQFEEKSMFLKKPKISGSETRPKNEIFLEKHLTHA